LLTKANDVWLVSLRLRVGRGGGIDEATDRDDPDADCTLYVVTYVATLYRGIAAFSFSF
jgi:hypothetical protein